MFRRLVVVSVVALVVISAVLFIRGRKPRQLHGEQIELLVYCAAGVKPPVLEAAEQYEREYGVRVRLQYGGSGTLLSNIQISRTGDLYLAADSSYTDMAQQKGLVAEVLALAHMTPVVTVKEGSGIDIVRASDLLKTGLRVALGNPEVASIGKQTQKVFESVGLWDELVAHVTADGVFKPTVPEIASDVALGAADAGIVWDAMVGQYRELKAIHLPELDQARKQVTVGVLSVCRRPTEALRFARYLNSTIGNAIFERNGYAAVEGDAWALHPEITFFCGSVNRRAVEPVLNRFMAREGCTINTVYNGCGILTGQMRTLRQDDESVGFPDVYMACDRYYLENVSEWFQEDVDISDTDIVIAVQRGNPKGIEGLGSLTRPGMRVAVGQPQQCTIGALTRIMLEKEGIWNAVMSNVVMQTASSAMLVPTVITKSVDATLAYATDTTAESNRVTIVRIDSASAKAVQPFSIARSSPYKHLGRRLLQAVARAREDFENAGFNYRLGQP